MILQAKLGVDAIVAEALGGDREEKVARRNALVGCQQQTVVLVGFGLTAVAHADFATEFVGNVILGVQEDGLILVRGWIARNLQQADLDQIAQAALVTIAVEIIAADGPLQRIKGDAAYLELLGELPVRQSGIEVAQGDGCAGVALREFPVLGTQSGDRLDVESPLALPIDGAVQTP